MILVLGGSGGLGKSVMATMTEPCIDWSRNGNPAVDLDDIVQLRIAANALTTPVDGVVNCVGINDIFPFDELTIWRASEAFRINAYMLVEVMQVLRRKNMLPAGARICNVISNAAHMPMSNSLCYNASKAAQEMITRQMARELKEYSIFGVSPNKLSGTPMSNHIDQRVCLLRGWTKDQAREYQLAGLPAGVETPARVVAEFIAYLMQPKNHPYLTGCILPYGGQQ